MIVDTFDLERVKNYLTNHPDSDVVIIANKKITAELYWDRIQQHLGIKKRPWIVSNAETWDGFPIMNSLVLKIGRWWENRNAKEFMKQARFVKLSLPITFIPPFVSKGGGAGWKIKSSGI